MPLTKEQRDGLGVALNEASLLGVEVDPERRVAGATFEVFSLPKEGSAPSDGRVLLVFQPVGRVAASLRNARWDDPEAAAVPFVLGELLATVQSFSGLPVYGWEFIDVDAKERQSWGKRLSLDWTSGSDGRTHSITLFQDAGNRILDLCVWFDELEIRDPEGNAIPLNAFIAAGNRWWDAFHGGDERTRGHGMFPLQGPAA